MADAPFQAFEQPSFARVLREGIDGVLADVHTCMPGVVDSYDAATQLAKVQPALQRKYKTGEVVDLPLLVNVPVLFPRSGKAFISFPLQKGDTVLLVFSERSLDTWKSDGGKVDPADTRRFHLSDAVAIPGLYPQSKPVAADATKVVVQNDQATMTLDPGGEIDLIAGGSAGLTCKLLPSGKVSFTNSLGEMMAALLQLFQDIQSAITNTSVGPQPLVMQTFAADLQKLQSFKA